MQQTAKLNGEKLKNYSLAKKKKFYKIGPRFTVIQLKKDQGRVCENTPLSPCK